jgi:hypothetical protein
LPCIGFRLSAETVAPVARTAGRVKVADNKAAMMMCLRMTFLLSI